MQRRRCGLLPLSLTCHQHILHPAQVPRSKKAGPAAAFPGRSPLWPGRGATGIGFTEPDIRAMYDTLQQAELLYSKRDSYKRVQQNGMAQNFSWQSSASQYLALYQQALAGGAQ